MRTVRNASATPDRGRRAISRPASPGSTRRTIRGITPRIVASSRAPISSTLRSRWSILSNSSAAASPAISPAAVASPSTRDRLGLTGSVTALAVSSTSIVTGAKLTVFSVDLIRSSNVSRAWMLRATNACWFS